MTKVALITGAGSGIGKAVAVALMHEGYAVTLAGRHRSALEETAAEGPAADARVLVVPTDVTNPEAVKALFSAARTDTHRLDLLFNNAGTSAPSIPSDLTIERWRAVLKVNRHVSVCAGSLPGDQGSDACARWSDHQQRLDSGSRSPAQLCALRDHKTRCDRTDPIDFTGWPQVRHRLWGKSISEMRIPKWLPG